MIMQRPNTCKPLAFHAMIQKDTKENDMNVLQGGIFLLPRYFVGVLKFEVHLVAVEDVLRLKNV